MIHNAVTINEGHTGKRVLTYEIAEEIREWHRTEPDTTHADLRDRIQNKYGTLVLRRQISKILDGTRWVRPKEIRENVYYEGFQASNLVNEPPILGETWRRLLPSKLSYDWVISTNGRIVCNQKFVIPTQDVFSYLRVVILPFSKTKKHYVHELVCASFHGEPEEYKTVQHLDGNRLNNHYTNLYWGPVLPDTTPQIVLRRREIQQLSEPIMVVRIKTWNREGRSIPLIQNLVSSIYDVCLTSLEVDNIIKSISTPLITK